MKANKTPPFLKKKTSIVPQLDESWVSICEAQEERKTLRSCRACMWLCRGAKRHLQADLARLTGARAKSLFASFSSEKEEFLFFYIQYLGRLRGADGAFTCSPHITACRQGRVGHRGNGRA
jgi:hypothetical protein